MLGLGRKEDATASKMPGHQRVGHVMQGLPELIRLPFHGDIDPHL